MASTRSDALRTRRIAMEKRSQEVLDSMRARRAGLHIEPAAELLDSLQLAADREFEMEHLNRESEELSLVQRALDAMRAGVYGRCVDCEEEISSKRLKVVPWAVRCLACQQRTEDSAANLHRHQDPEPLHV